MRILQRESKFTTDIAITASQTIYAINDRDCLTIRIEKTTEKDMLILFTSEETRGLKRFIEKYMKDRR